MGWRYEYALLPNVDLKLIKEKAAAIGFQDLTKVLLDYKKWDAEQLERVRAARTVEEFRKEMESLPQDEELVKFLKATDASTHKLGIYTLRFYRCAGGVLLFWSGPHWDIDGSWFALAMMNLLGLGYRGEVILVRANSVSDSADVAFMDLTDDNLAVKDKIGGGEAQYEETLREARTPVNLLAIHNALLDELGDLELAVGKYLEVKQKEAVK